MDTFSHYWKSDFTPRIRKGYSSTGHLFTGWQKYRKSITSTNLFCLTQPLCLQSNNVTGRQKGQSTPGVHVERLQPTLGKKHPELTNRAGADGRSLRLSHRRCKPKQNTKTSQDIAIFCKPVSVLGVLSPEMTPFYSKFKIPHE